MNLFAFMKDQDMLQAHVSDWLEKRRELKCARAATFEALVAERVIGVITELEAKESDIERDLTRLEIKIDAALNV